LPIVDWDCRLGLSIGDCRLGLPIGIADWDCRLGLPIGIADWDCRLSDLRSTADWFFAAAAYYGTTAGAGLADRA
jgi:hypothetical protein